MLATKRHYCEAKLNNRQKLCWMNISLKPSRNNIFKNLGNNRSNCNGSIIWRELRRELPLGVESILAVFHNSGKLLEGIRSRKVLANLRSKVPVILFITMISIMWIWVTIKIKIFYLWRCKKISAFRNGKSSFRKTKFLITLFTLNSIVYFF